MYRNSNAGGLKNISRLSVKSSLLFSIILFTKSFAWGQLQVDAQYRNRFEVRDGYRQLTSDGMTPAVFISQRTRLSVHYVNDGLKVTFTPQDVRVWGDEQLASSTGVYGDAASLDLFEAFVEIKTGSDAWLSIGRQPLVYDNQRILGARNWNQNGLAYDALVWKWQSEDWSVHLGTSWNSTGENISDNYYPSDRIKSLSFLWLQRIVSKDWQLSFSHVASGVTRSEAENHLYFRQTTGLYSTWKKEDWQARGNLYYQFGKNQTGTNVSALLLDAEVTYRRGRLEPGVGLSYLSGNSQTGSGQKTDHLFDVLYGARHRFFGGMDYYRSFTTQTKQAGLVDYHFFTNGKLSAQTSLTNTFHYFRLAQTNQDTPTNKNLGYENDLVIKHQLTGWGVLEGGYLLYCPSQSLKTLQGISNGRFSQFFYLQLTITPALFRNQQFNI